MKKFILIVCGSFVGAFLAFMFFMIAAMIMSFAIMGSMSMGGSKNSASVSKHSILKLDLGTSIEERGGDEPIDMMSLMQGQGLPSSLGLNTVVSAIEKAAKDDKVDGIYIECNGVSAAPATLEKVRRALKQFKKSGKWIAAYGHEGINQADYYLASVADSIYINPVGALDLHGMASVTPYMKKFLDKVGVEMQVVRVGTFKSAVEPYMLDSISPANRLQQETYMGNIWKSMVDTIATSRKLTAEKINYLADNMIAMMPVDSLLSNKIVDKVCYRNEMDNRLRALTDVDKDKDLNLVSPQDLAASASSKSKSSKNVIAIVYASGEIDGSESVTSGNGINSEELCETIYSLRDDKDIKGMVLRVNSPGGSAFGSEQIWKAIDDFKKEGKTVAVSMGDLAASGGYYISAGADRIFALPTTITGSIGIFGMIPCINGLVEDKLGVNISIVKTNKNSEAGVLTKPLTPFQKDALQQMVNRGYELFTNRCAQGRHVSQDSIKQIAEGRVWDGVSAKKIGLVDEFGNVDSAVKWVAKKANLADDYCTDAYPAPKTKWEKMLKKYATISAQKRMKGELGFLYDYYIAAEKVLGRNHVLCLMEPVAIDF